MKSEERHPLQRNDPAGGTTDLLGLWRRHGNTVLVVLAIALLVLAAVRYKRTQAAARQQQTEAALTGAWNGVEQMAQILSPQAPPGRDAARATLEADVNQSVQIVVDDADAPAAQRAQAWLARGELYWQLAHAPAPTADPLAASQPSSQPSSGPSSGQPASRPAAKSAGEYLDLAANAYGKVVGDFADQVVPATVARFSLAATAEERHDLAAARTQYKALIETPGLVATDKTLAENRLAALGTLEKPMLLLAATPPEQHAGEEMLQGLAGPSMPFTMGPAAPATRPVPAAGPAPATLPAATAATPATQPR